MDDIGFPRKLDQADYFEELVGAIDVVMVLDCPRETMQARLLQRQRKDDDEGTIEKRVATFETTTAEVLRKFEARGNVVKIQADASQETVHASFLAALKKADIYLEGL